MSRLREALSDLPRSVFADLLESDDAYLLVVDLPGATSETTDVVVEDGKIRIEAHREKDVPEGYSYEREERSLFIDLELPLPRDATADGSTASLNQGVLELRLRKRDTGGRTIEVEDEG